MQQMNRLQIFAQLMLLDEVRVIALFAIYTDSVFVMDQAAALGMTTADYMW
jgi:hypothetical protein